MPVNQKVGEQFNSMIKPSRHVFCAWLCDEPFFCLEKLPDFNASEFSIINGGGTFKVFLFQKMKSSIDCICRLSNADKRRPFSCCSPITLHLKCVISSIKFSSSVSVGSAAADCSIVVSLGSAEDAECCWDSVIGMVNVVAVGFCRLWE